jgi:hypothetical protein
MQQPMQQDDAGDARAATPANEEQSRTTLPRWFDRLTRVPGTIECPEMQLLSGVDHEGPVFVGTGIISIPDASTVEFTMFARPAEGADGVSRLRRSQENPYEVFDQFRLVATDYQGTEWQGGWVRPQIKGLPRIGYPLTGRVHRLTTVANGPWVSADSSVELVFVPKFELPMDKAMVSVVSIGDEVIRRGWEPGQQVLSVLDTSVRFFYTPSHDSLWITARTSDKFRHPYAENWVSEPLRILLGQLAHPRLVARNFGDGSALVSYFPATPRYSTNGLASLLEQPLLADCEEFWKSYSELLTVIAEARGTDGHPAFEPHHVTRFFDEVTQATQSSRWVLCMTLASSAEGIARLMMPARSRMKVDTYMKGLVKTGVLTREHQRSWTAVRHLVMHGQLVSQWATKQEDQKIMQLADLVRRLTREFVRLRLQYTVGEVRPAIRRTSQDTSSPPGAPAS